MSFFPPFCPCSFPSRSKETITAYFEKLLLGASIIESTPSAQNAYPPCASVSGCAEMPPSNVWPDQLVLASTDPSRKAKTTHIYGRNRLSP